MPIPEGGEVLFDGELEPGLDIPRLWESGKPYSVLSPRKDMRRAGSLLLREHLSWRFAQKETESPEAMQAVIDTANRHFRQLHRMGMSIVTHETVVNDTVDWPVDPGENDGGSTVAFSASAYVANLKPLHMARMARAISKKKVEEFVIGPLREYVSWGASTGETELLFDLFSAEQYGWHSDTGVVFLHDIGPHLATRGTVTEAMYEDLERSFEHVGSDFRQLGRL